MDYNVWRIESDGSQALWDGPLSQENAEKVRFTRQRDADAEHGDDILNGRPGKPATFVVVVEGSEPRLSGYSAYKFDGTHIGWGPAYERDELLRPGTHKLGDA